jgi:hypothetical protein
MPAGTGARLIGAPPGPVESVPTHPKDVPVALVATVR